MKSHYLRLLGIPLIYSLSLNIYAGGYEVPLAGASQIGTAIAGEAALAQDASTGFYNPAGLTLLKSKQFVGSLTAVDANLQFKGNVTASSLTGFSFLDYSANDVKVPLTARGFVPAFHFAMPVRDNLVMAFGIVTPYGLGVEAPRNSEVRYSMEQNSLAIVDFTPSLGFKINDQLSVGLGLDAAFGVEASQNAERFAGDDGKLELVARGWGYGWHGGVLYQVLPTTRIGLTYHSMLTINMKGYSTFTVPPLGGLPGASFQSHLLSQTSTLPPTTALGFFHNLSEKWDLMGTIKYQQWNKLGYSRIFNIITPAGFTDSITALRYKNVLEYNIGARYAVNPYWQVGMGTGFAPTPTNNGARTLYYMDADRYLVTLGVRYQPCPDRSFDLGFGHYIFKTSPVNHVTATTTETGRSHDSANALGFQYTQNFA